MSDKNPRPRAFRLDDQRVAVDDARASASPMATILSQSDPTPFDPAAALDPSEREIEAAQAAGVAKRRRWSLATTAWTGLGGLVSLAIGLWIDGLIEALYARAQSLGAIALGFLALLAVGALGLLAREIFAIRRQRRIAELHAALARARSADDREAARALVAQLASLYLRRPETARARAEIEEARSAVVDGRDLIDVAERALLLPIDRQVRGEIAAAARRVSLVTAVSPRAILDLIFVAAQVVRLARRIAQLYGGRPGLLGFFALLRSIGAHLAITGGMAVGDSLLQQVVGHGIASRISARMGEGVLNGLLTARVGLSAMAVCRPAPFEIDKAPGVAEVAPFLFRKPKE
ncbi:MAG: TIGR01620 family protein [Bradyrhizobium sp.]|nr:MAG: TIGR01620 family protein [Bradyrhizobium sp.]